MRLNLFTLGLVLSTLSVTAPVAQAAKISAGASAVKITPYGQNPEWTGGITSNGVWGEAFTDLNRNGVWEAKEPFVDDPRNTKLDQGSNLKYDGIYLAGFGNNRLATGMHDDLWVRTLVIDDGVTRIAFVSLDLLGYFERGTYYGLDKVRARIGRTLGLSEIVLTSTHNHEGPDTIGPWGSGFMADGKYPLYLEFVDRMIAKSLTEAVKSLTPVTAFSGSTNPVESPEIAGMQTRTRGRPPEFFDQELRVLKFISQKTKTTVATMIQWGTHVESMEDENTLITSDFPHAVRETVEAEHGGIALYVSGAVGAVEIIGDSNNKPTDRFVFDGKAFPLDPKSHRPQFTFERTMAIGRDVGKAALKALAQAREMNLNDRPITLKTKQISMPMDNTGYKLFLGLGVLDIDFAQSGILKSPIAESPVHLVSFGDVQMITTPGELFPEIFYGVAQFGRTDCPKADTGLPREPSVKDLMGAKHQWVIGLSPNEYGYIVPLYDFRAPKWGINGPTQTPDACANLGVPNHYHEFQSASSRLAPMFACAAKELLTGIPAREHDPSCK